MSVAATASGPARLQAVPRHYAWGDRAFIPALLGVPADGRPWAELWLGAHPSAPALLDTAAGAQPLDAHIATAPAAVLGAAVARRFGQLPYLLKVLAAARPLSIQAHPSKRQARAGFRREQDAGIALDAPHRNYRDANHKPELIVALTPFHGLCGFRPLDEIAAMCDAQPALRAALPDFAPTPAALRRAFARFMKLPQARVDAVLAPLLDELAAADRRAPFPRTDHRHWALRAHAELAFDGHHDRGLLAFFLLNLVRLEPGAGLYLEAGVLHAYLEGAGIEIMASSDNVLRGGLTEKHVDVDELVRTVRFEGGRPTTLMAREDGRAAQPGVAWRVYATATAEFELACIGLRAGEASAPRTSAGAEIVLVSTGAGAVLRSSGNPDLALACGQAAFIPHGVAHSLVARADTAAFAARLPARARSPRA